MTDPSPEVVAAALALAEAVDRSVRDYKTTSKTIGVPEIDSALQRYRAAIAQKRTRAEVDAEIARVVHMYLDTEVCPTDALQLVHTLRVLCREETAHDRSNP